MRSRREMAIRAAPHTLLAAVSFCLGAVAYRGLCEAEHVTGSSSVTAEVYVYSGGNIIDEYETARITRKGDVYLVDAESEDGVKYSAIVPVASTILEIEK